MLALGGESGPCRCFKFPGLSSRGDVRMACFLLIFTAPLLPAACKHMRTPFPISSLPRCLWQIHAGPWKQDALWRGSNADLSIDDDLLMSWPLQHVQQNNLQDGILPVSGQIGGRQSLPLLPAPADLAVPAGFPSVPWF